LAAIRASYASAASASARRFADRDLQLSGELLARSSDDHRPFRARAAASLSTCSAAFLRASRMAGSGGGGVDFWSI
jgi:hypothetical protein